MTSKAFRENVEFGSQGTTCRAWFYPVSGEEKRPGIVMAHGLAGTREMRLDAYAEQFQAAGYHVLLFDYRFYGASDGQPRRVTHIPAQLEDWEAAIRYARQRPEVDPASLVLWGSSLSGGHVITLGARHPEVAAVIAQVPHLTGIAALRMLNPATQLGLSLHGLYDLLRAALHLSPHLIRSSAPVGQLGLMNTPGAEAGMRRLVPPGETFNPWVSARTGLEIGMYFPGPSLPRLAMPTLVQVCLEDRVTPPGPALALARRSPAITLQTFHGGHFDPYVAPLFNEVMPRQIHFLNRIFRKAENG